LEIMSTLELMRRAAAHACGAFALLSAVACQNALAQSGLPVRDIRVDVAPLRASAGDPTASWVQQELPDQLSKALAGRMTANGGTLVVQIDTVAFGPIKDSWAWDNIGGVAIIGGVRRPVRATTRHQASPIDQAMVEQSNHDRVTQLVQALSFWLAGHL
jgi:predicted NBD/HSP70 family sugar kinase